MVLAMAGKLLRYIITNIQCSPANETSSRMQSNFSFQMISVARSSRHHSTTRSVTNGSHVASLKTHTGLICN